MAHLTDKTKKHDPISAATVLAAFMECGKDIQNIVEEMTSIVNDDDSTDEERELAGDALIQALFPGTAADVLVVNAARLRLDEDSSQAASELNQQESNFADRLREKMDARSMTQETLASLTGVGQPAISNMLNRRCRPQRRTIVKLADALGVLPHELWDQF